MTNLDYEHRMNALNQLIHETLGVSLNTVRAAYGRAKNTSINVKSTASETGRLPRSSARQPAFLTSDIPDNVAPGRSAPFPNNGVAGIGLPANIVILDRPHPILDTVLLAQRKSFLTRFRNAKSPGEDYIPERSDVLPMAIFANDVDDAGESASDWHRLRNEFWSIARTDKVIMERYKRDVLG